MIKNYKEFSINESGEVEEHDDIVDIFTDMIDDGFNLDVERAFFREDGFLRENENTEFKIPGIKIVLRKDDQSKLTEDLTLSVIGYIGESIDRLSDLGEVIIKELNLSYNPPKSNFRIQIYLLQKHKEVELSDKDGFYDFIATLRNKFNRLSNKVTNSFTIESGKDEVILVPKEGIDSKQLLSATKSQLKKFFDPWHMGWRNRLPYEYTYDVKLDDNKIHLIYKERFQIDRHNRRIEE